MKQEIKKVLRQVLGYSVDKQTETETETEAETGNCQSTASLQVYSGYEEQDLAVLKKFATVTAAKDIDHYTDGFGVKTLYECVPFENLNRWIFGGCSCRCRMIAFMLKP